MHVGSTIESAIWLTGTEPEHLRDRYERDVRESIAMLCAETGFVHGPVTFTVKQPGDDRVPPVPDHISGPDVRLLVAEAEVVGQGPEVSTRGFVGELDAKDLERLRGIVRRQRPELSDVECDDVIEELGPGAALDALEHAVNGGAVH